MFIDLHCHILPKIDDGADSFEESVQMINQAALSGTTIMVATPHYNNPLQGHKHYKKNHVLSKYSEFKEKFAQLDIPVKLLLGAELLASSNLKTLCRENEIIPVNGTRYVLTEFDFKETYENVNKYSSQLISFGFIPLIAHPERYESLSDDYTHLFELADKGCRYQINKGSLFGQHGDKAKTTAGWIIAEGLCSLFASDCHSVNNRNSDMRELYEWLVERYSMQDITKLTHDNPKRILLNLDV